jgi:acetylornithine deacetylase
MPAAIDTARLQDLLASMVRINSVNPTLGASSDGAPGAAGETMMADYVETILRDIGMEVDRWEAAPGRPNVVGILRGSGTGRSLLLNAHMDTVGVAGMDAPFEPTVRDGRMYGRGTQDMKASLAAQLEAARLLAHADAPLAGDLIVAAVSDEEHKSVGTEALVERYAPEGAVVTEPTDMELAIAHKGFVWIDIETHGRAAHGSRPKEGIDANMHMGRVLAELEALGQSLRHEEHPLLGARSLHVGRLRGGSEPSVYAARCHLRMERRTLPGDTPDAVLGAVTAILDRLQDADDAFRATAEVAFARHPLQTPPDAPIAEAVRQSAADVLGTPPPDIGASFWTDAALHAAAGTETVVFGPVGAGLHTTEEWVDLESVGHLARVLVATARRYCR